MPLADRWNEPGAKAWYLLRTAHWAIQQAGTQGHFRKHGLPWRTFQWHYRHISDSLCWIKRTCNSEYRIYVLFPCRFVESFLFRSCFRLKSYTCKFSFKVLGEEFACLNLHYMSRICGQWSLKSDGRRAAYGSWGSCSSDCKFVDGYCYSENRAATLARIVPWRLWQFLQKRTSVPNYKAQLKTELRTETWAYCWEDREKQYIFTGPLEIPRRAFPWRFRVYMIWQ